jgi:hypothetical protein
MHLLYGKENGQKYIKLFFEFFGVAKKFALEKVLRRKN